MTNNNLKHWSSWSNNKTPEALNNLVDNFQVYCVENMDSLYDIATSSNKYHGASKHILKTDADNVTRMLDDNGKNLSFSPDMDIESIKINSIEMIATMAPDVIAWRLNPDKSNNRLVLTAPIDAGCDIIGSGLKSTGKHELAKFETNAQTIILEKTNDYDEDDNMLGFRIITEYPEIRKVQSLYNKEITSPDFRAMTTTYRVHDVNNIKIERHDENINPDDVYDGVKRSETFKSYNRRYSNAGTLDEQKRVESMYDRAMADKGFTDSPNIRGEKRKVPLKFEELLNNTNKYNNDFEY